jgi:hypothetical protein
MGENWIPKIEWQMIPQLSNPPLAKTFAISHTYNSFLQKLSDVNNFSIWLHMQKIWISKKIQNENKNEFFVWS